MLNRDEQEVEKYLENMLDSNALEDLDSWMQIVSSAEFASSTNNPASAEALYKLALNYAEKKMSSEVVINALLCLSSFYKKYNRVNEAETAYARAIALFNVLPASED